MSKVLDLTGQPFGHLVAREVVIKDGKRLWLCECDCGRTIITTASKLRSYRRSCGCKQPKSKDITDQPFGDLTAIKVDGRTKSGCKLWLCKCVCGGHTRATASDLTNGKRVSCGCRNGPEDLTNRPFDRLTAIKRVGKYDHGTKWLCKCDCGNFTTVSADKLLSGHTRSCGCLKKGPRYDLKYPKEYNTWLSIKTRCRRKHHHSYSSYGAKGIDICDLWFDGFEAFLKGVGEAPEPKDQYSLDRIDNTKGYEPGNCRWASTREQARNKRTTDMITYNGQTKCLADWAKELGLVPNSLRSRLRSGWSLEKTLTTPPMRELPHMVDHSKAAIYKSEYTAWLSMKTRVRSGRYKGVKFCDRWENSFDNFLEDMGEKPQPKRLYSLDRIDPHGDYEPKNCRWATKETQHYNKRDTRRITWNGETKTIKEWAEYFGVKDATLRMSLRRGNSMDEIHERFTRSKV
jgi:hypothetical protein